MRPNAKLFLAEYQRKTAIWICLDRIKIFIPPYDPPLKSVENCYSPQGADALRAGYAAPAPRSPGPCDAGRIGREKIAQEAMKGRGGFPVPMTVSGYTSR
ncbi:hypothetical protein AA19596_1391 [Acetobacter fabarum DSM 19596]|nr:hypothetical protein AA19596_1391 [Acetobacter fabarum DSM 19596]